MADVKLSTTIPSDLGHNFFGNSIKDFTGSAFMQVTPLPSSHWHPIPRPQELDTFKTDSDSLLLPAMVVWILSGLTLP